MFIECSHILIFVDMKNPVRMYNKKGKAITDEALTVLKKRMSLQYKFYNLVTTRFDQLYATIQEQKLCPKLI